MGFFLVFYRSVKTVYLLGEIQTCQYQRTLMNGGMILMLEQLTLYVYKTHVYLSKLSLDGWSFGGYLHIYIFRVVF